MNVSNETYSSKLKNPLWQRKRLEVFERDNWKCTACKCGTRELQVHHVEYLGDLQPWEYPIELLSTLCADCHGNEQRRYGVEKNLAIAFKVRGFLYSDLVALSTLLHSNDRFTNHLLKTIRTYAEAIY